MQVDSYLELFTTFYGWAFANIIGEIITGTGLVVVPFALVILFKWREAKEAGAQDIGILSVIESIQTRLVVMMLVLSLGFFTSPIATLSASRIGYTPRATLEEPSPTTARPGASDSSFDAAMADALDGTISPSGNLTYVPLWWYSVMSLSSGINNAFRSGLTDNNMDLRYLENMARNMTIEDPKLRHEVQRFYSECFTPARSQFMQSDRTTLSANGQSIIDPENTTYGAADVDWMGSQLFRTEAGYYDSIRSRGPVPGFAVDLSRDTDYYDASSGLDPNVTGAVNPEFGRPTCKQWWENQLRDQLVSHSSIAQRLMAGMTASGKYASIEAAKDAAAKIASTTANPGFVDSEKVMGYNYDTATTIGRAITGTLSAIGVGKESFISSLTMLPLMTGLPMAQALVLMALYTFLPLVLFMSAFDPRILFIGGAAIFTVKLWATMWYIAQWIDAKLINAMYPGALSNIFIQEVVQTFSSPVPATYKRGILNILMAVMFIGFPIIWTTMMAWIGVNVAGGIAGVLSRAEAGANTQGRTSGVNPMKIAKLGKK